MSDVKSLVMGLVVVASFGSTCFGDSLTNGTWRWTTWSPSTGVVLGPSLPSQTATMTVPSSVPVAVAPAPIPTQPLVAVVDPANWQEMGRFALTTGSPAAPVAQPAPVAPVVAPAQPIADRPDAFLNLGAGPFAQPGSSLSYAARPWWESGTVRAVYGGTPTPEQQAAFSADVLNRVSSIYRDSGVPADLTLDPHAGAPHSLSVVSVADSGAGVLQNKLGETGIGGDGMTFIDQFKDSATPDQLANAVSVNVAHELMHAFGLAEHHDETGAFVDSGEAHEGLLHASNPLLSPTSVQQLLSMNFQARSSGLTMNLGPIGVATANQLNAVAASPVPEPATVIGWTVVCLGLALRGRKRLSRSAR